MNLDLFICVFACYSFVEKMDAPVNFNNLRYQIEESDEFINCYFLIKCIINNCRFKRNGGLWDGSGARM
jgi:hypothetical protein